MNMYPIEVLGADETASAGLFKRLVAPTEFDKAAEAIRKRLKAEYTWDLFNTELWGLIGLAGEPIKRWLTLYIKESNRLKKPYYQSDLTQWENIFEGYGYDKKKTDIYLRVLRQLYDEGAISETIFRPFNYQATEEPEAGEIVWYETRKVIYGSIGLVVAGSVGYFLLRDVFSGKFKGK